MSQEEQDRPKDTEPGHVNRNGQVTIRDTGIGGNDYLQRIYQLGCSQCGHIYGANGSDIFQRKCPKCGGGKAGFPYAPCF